MMSNDRRHFDRLTFATRIIGVVVVATLCLVWSIRARHYADAIAAVSVGYVLIPVLCYFWTRHGNSFGSRR